MGRYSKVMFLGVESLPIHFLASVAPKRMIVFETIHIVPKPATFLSPGSAERGRCVVPKNNTSKELVRKKEKGIVINNQPTNQPTNSRSVTTCDWEPFRDHYSKRLHFQFAQAREKQTFEKKRTCGKRWCTTRAN